MLLWSFWPTVLSRK